VVTSASPQILERSLQNLDIGAWWDAIGKSTTLQKILGTKRVRETGEEVRSHLTDLWRRRNFIAHAGDEDVTLSDSNVFSAIDFIEALAVALDQEVKQRLK
jgi:hypothetical protein